ncbi:MAG: hypothetical protein IAI50_19115 [Candidatus Eremiobacteraeota bacterium]|nr:hypothetical protein [Candidatus Eremiobacteraeota bacterium]
MNASVDVFLRLAAFRARRAMPLTQTYRIAPDPAESFAIAPLRVVAEDFIQVVAFGNPDDAPMIVHEAMPLSRATAFLEPLSDALDEYIRRAVDQGGVRIYLPHRNALEMLTLMAPRFEHNKEASAKIRRLGYLARILRELAYMPGQQVVVVMSDALRGHAVSGSSPIKDAQLRYMVTWMNPPPGVDVEVAADEAALSPAAGMLYFKDDESIEDLRHRLKSKKGDAMALRSEIERIQDRNALAEWQVLTQARDALWGMQLSAQPRLTELAQQNLDYLRRALDGNTGSAKYAHPMARLYEDFGAAFTVAQAASIEADDRAFEAEVQKGKCIRGRIDGRHLPSGPNRKPQHFTIVSEQRVLRLREGMKLRLRNAGVLFSVSGYERYVDGTSRIEVSVLKGVRLAGRLQVGALVSLIEGEGVAFRGLLRPLSNIDGVDIPSVNVAVGRGEAAIDPSLDLEAIAVALRRPI